ncbi:hypothetical protein [Clostridium sp. HBUAS56017]|uniref:DUF7657 domain-containing protein n=1 Tax=Clostridium sp. HBUAS56017 TaxID=2571128 RepID=UPI001177B00C|nr:hypothetical protein [Clostridium sp. HBUAS56017]
MGEKLKYYIKLLIPLLILVVLNFYVMEGKRAIITALVIVALYIFILFITERKNNIINIDNIHRKRYHIAIMLFVVLVAFKFHGSSIQYWDNYYRDYGDNYTKTIFWGEPRSIRSDEWLSQTPMYMAQASQEGGLERYNTNINPDGQDMVMAYSTPVADLTMIGNPVNWGYLFLDQERAFSWYWNFKAIALFLLSYEMALILSKRSKNIALFGAALISYAAASQWWFSTVIPNLVMYSQACIVVTYYYFRVKSNSIKSKIALATIFAISGIGYILNLYPAIQVPLGYLTAILFLYLAFKNRDKIKKKDIIIFSTSIVAILGVIGYFLITAKDSIQAISNTVYPGARFEIGGNYDLKLISNYIFDWLLPYREIKFSNASELSGFVSLLPLIIILFFFKKKEDEDKILINVLFVYMLIMLSFLLVSYPRIIAKVTLFSYSTTNRMMVIMGLACNYLLFMLLPRLKEGITKLRVAIPVTIITIFIIFIPHYHTISHDYLRRSGAIIAILIFSTLIYLIARRDIKRLVPYGVILMLITGFTVNPIARTLAPILQKEVSKAVTSINKESPGKWVAIGERSRFGGQFLFANGVETYNGVKYYPNLDMWHALDEERKYEDVYNRFEHTIVNLTEDETKFILLQPDCIEVRININSFDKTGVKYVMSSENLDFYNKNGKQLFKQLYYNETDHTYIYEYIKE